MKSIISLPEKISKLKDSDKELFHRFFLLQRSTGKLELPEGMKPWVKKTFGSVESIRKQVIIKILNKLIFEEALYNELRAKRPKQAKEEIDLKSTIQSSKKGPFSNPLEMMPADTFGRIKGKHCVTASNIAKYDGLHGLVVFDKHNPLSFTEAEVQDHFQTALKWFSKANKSNEKAKYPFILWNCLWRAAASIIHGHMQMVLGEGFHYAEAESINRARHNYHSSYKSDFFEDFYKVHEKIGLGFKKGGISIFTNVVPREDKEITIISDELDEKHVRAVYKAVKMLMKEFNVKSFNMGTVMKPLGKYDEWDGFPVVTRIVDRGKLGERTADIGGMELYEISTVISTDPYIVFDKLKKYF